MVPTDSHLGVSRDPEERRLSHNKGDVVWYRVLRHKDQSSLVFIDPHSICIVVTLYEPGNLEPPTNEDRPTPGPRFTSG